MAIERTFALIKTGALDRGHGEAIRTAIKKAGLRILHDGRFGTSITPDDAARFGALYRDHAGRGYYTALMQSVSTISIGLVLHGRNAIEAWRVLQGPTDPAKARDIAPQSLRALYGGEAMPDNATHGSDSAAAAEREIAIFFPEMIDG